VQPSVSVSRGREGSGNAFSAELSVTLQPSTRLLVTLEPSYKQSTDGAQYVTSSKALTYDPTYGTRYVFADLERRDLSMVTRVNMTFTPKLSLELFAQPLITSADFVRYKQLVAPETFDFDVFQEGSGTFVDAAGRRYLDFNRDGIPDADFADRDFNLRSLRGTAVLRWEYRPGSEIFVVWQRSQLDRAGVGDFDFGRDADALFGAPADNRFIVKVNYWFGL
jgi:hypothetical protein